MKRLLAAACATILVAAPAAAHTEAELADWHTDWQTRFDQAIANHGAIDFDLMDERHDWLDRHPCSRELGTYRPDRCRPAQTHSTTTASTGTAPTGVNTGMGSNVEQWRPIVEQYFGANTNAALRVMACESGGNPNAKNRRSTASGLFQFLASTWTATTGEQYPGNVFHGPSNIAAAAKLSKGGTTWRAWSCKP